MSSSVALTRPEFCDLGSLAVRVSLGESVGQRSPVDAHLFAGLLNLPWATNRYLQAQVGVALQAADPRGAPGPALVPRSLPE